MVYIELLVKENLKAKNYLIEYPLLWQPLSTLRNPSTLRIHDTDKEILAGQSATDGL
jgi:hypothetical protein